MGLLGVAARCTELVGTAELLRQRARCDLCSANHAHDRASRGLTERGRPGSVPHSSGFSRAFSDGDPYPDDASPKVLADRRLGRNAVRWGVRMLSSMRVFDRNAPSTRAARRHLTLSGGCRGSWRPLKRLELSVTADSPLNSAEFKIRSVTTLAIPLATILASEVAENARPTHDSRRDTNALGAPTCGCLPASPTSCSKSFPQPTGID